MHKIIPKHGLLAISPLLLLISSFVGLGWWLGDFYKVPLVLLFVVAAIYALFLTSKKTKSDTTNSQRLSVTERVEIFSRGAGESGLLMMVWIFLLAGAFAEIAKAMGAVDAMVNLTLSIFPPSLLLPSIFIAACLVSLSIGTSIGTIVAIAPVALGLADSTAIPSQLLLACVVGGAFFGDNLSFISDTTIVATRSQGVRQSDKFRANIQLALPAALLCLGLYAFLGGDYQQVIIPAAVAWWKVIPYFMVIAIALTGLDVMLVLILGIILAATVGLLDGTLGLEQVLQTASEGMATMNETIIITLLTGGLMALIRHNGGIDFILSGLTRHIKGKRGAEAAISALVAITDCCTANNTIAILTVGKISKDIAQRFGVKPEKTASLLDTFSCIVQGLLPYGAQLLIASSLSKLSPFEIIPYLYYTYALVLVAVLSIIFRFPRKYS